MKTTYSIQWLQTAVDKNQSLKYLFFWGHRQSKHQKVSKSCFSQWYESPFTVNKKTYQSTEHWMMAHKALLFDNKEVYDKILTCKTPAEAKKLGRQVTGFDEEIWKKHRYTIVILGNIHKFNQNKALGNYLLQTNHRILVEASPVDPIWGIGLAQDHKHIYHVDQWRGLNLLGFALMETRDFIKNHGFFKTKNKNVLPWEIESLNELF